MYSAKAKAAKRQIEIFSWQISNPEQPPAESQFVEPYHSFVAAKLLPKRAYENPEAIKSETGEELLRPNTFLVGLVGGLEAVCTANGAPEDPKGRVFGPMPTYDICFVDTDSDSKFDAYFRYGRLLHGEIVFPKKMEKTVPFRIKSTDVRKYPGTESAYVQYNGKGYLNVCYKKDRNIVHGMLGLSMLAGCLEPEIKIIEKNLPVEFEALGARFLAKSKNDGKIEIQQLTSIPPQDFEIRSYLF